MALVAFTASESNYRATVLVKITYLVLEVVPVVKSKNLNNDRTIHMALDYCVSILTLFVLP